ncbi:MAG: DUF393 domain-containing protein [Bryobacterales bacterium]|jgi:predicted DCC family thiol-disulfide oxidoreductase YuxK|nr:DUF393 domain-containing protein [Bryobacterales bacterium]
MANAAKLTVFYDGDCGFCERSVALVRALDWLGRFRYATLQGSEARAAGIAVESRPSEVVLYRPAATPTDVDAGSQWGGWHAVKQIGFRLPAFYLALSAAFLAHPALGAVLLCCVTPLANPLGRRLYRWIARNRHRLPASTCRLENP